MSQNNPKLIKENSAIQITNKFRFSFLSAICPAKGAKKKAGKNSQRPIIPSDSGSPVKLYTCHSITTNCIDQPNTNAKRTNKKMLNSLILKAAYGSFLVNLVFS